MAPVDPENLAASVIEAARRAGAGDADVLVRSGYSIGIDMRGGALEQADRDEGVQVGLRVLLGGRQASVSSSDHEPRAIAAMAERAVAMAREAPVDDTAGLADPDQLAVQRDAGGLELADQGPDPAPDGLGDAALRAEAAARDVPGISQVEQASAGFSRQGVWLAATNGFSGGYARTSHGISVVAITGEGPGMERDHAGEQRAWAADLPAPEEIGRLAAERALARAGSRKPPTGPFPILFDRRVSASLIGHLLSAVNGTAIARGASWLRRDLGQSVLPEGVDLFEDPLRPRYPSSRPFDAEGLQTRARMIVANGILQGWTLDLATGRKLGMASTASAARGMASIPSPSVSNVILTPGGTSRNELIAAMGRGLVVTSMLGSSVSATTGDYSRGAAGFWVENGRLAYPVNECTIAGNLRDMLQTMVPADDPLPWRGAEVPSLLIRGMTVAGA